MASERFTSDSDMGEIGLEKIEGAKPITQISYHESQTSAGDFAIDPVSVLDKFRHSPASTEKEQDLVLWALMLQHQGEGRWKPIILGYNKLCLGPARQKDWLLRRSRRFSAKQEGSSKTEAHTSLVRANEVPPPPPPPPGEAGDMPFKPLFRALRRAVSGDPWAKGFPQDVLRLREDLKTSWQECGTWQLGQLDGLMFDAFCGRLHESYPFRASRGSNGFCCRDKKCRSSFIVGRALDGLGLDGDGRLFFITLSELLQRSLRRIDWKGIQSRALEHFTLQCDEGGDVWPWAGLVLLSGKYCPLPNCIYRKPMKIFRHELVDFLLQLQSQFQQDAVRPLVESSISNSLRARMTCRNLLDDPYFKSMGKIQHLDEDSQIRVCVRTAYVQWLCKHLILTLSMDGTCRMQRWHTVFHWEEQMMSGLHVQKQAISWPDVDSHDACCWLQGFLDINLKSFLNLPGVDIDRRLLCLWCFASAAAGALRLPAGPVNQGNTKWGEASTDCNAADAQTASACEVSQSEGLSCAKLVVSPMKPGTLVVVRGVSSIQGVPGVSPLSGLSGEVVGRRGSHCLVKIPNQFMLHQVPAYTLSPIGPDRKELLCASCHQGLGFWSCATCLQSRYCSESCQEVDQKAHSICCAAASHTGIYQDSRPDSSPMPMLGCEEMIDQLEYAQMQMRKSTAPMEDSHEESDSSAEEAGNSTDNDETSADEDCAREEGPYEVSEENVWNAVVMAEDLSQVLQSDADTWQDKGDKPGCIVDASRTIIWAYALTVASEGRCFLGQIDRAIDLADLAIPVLTRMLQGYTLVGCRENKLPDPVILLIRMHHSKHTAILSDFGTYKRLGSMDRQRSSGALEQLCERFGLQVHDFAWRPDNHNLIHNCRYEKWLRQLHRSGDFMVDDDFKESIDLPDDQLDSNVVGSELLVACKSCGERLPRQRMKSHRRSHCSMREVRCQNCGHNCMASDLAKHLAEECELLLVTCSLCQERVPQRDLQLHLQQSCKFRVVPCSNDGCAWKDVFDNLRAHELSCPFAKETCPWCLEVVQAQLMPSHSCSIVMGDHSCTLCCNKFSDLALKGNFPVILLLGGQRACSHSQFCSTCAKKWLSRAASKSPSAECAECPLCRAHYDGLAQLPHHLLVQVSVPQQAAPLPRLFECPVGAVHWVSPLNVHFMHAGISPVFKEGDIAFGWRKPSILDTMQQLLSGAEPPELDCLDVVWMHGKIFVAGSGNRRLCMWRLLAIYFPERWAMMKVRFVSLHRVRVERMFDTKCKGEYVEVRFGNLVGKSKTGNGRGTDPGVRWPEAERLLEGELAKFA
eukprot:TRINITY_DN19287_c1_g1_i1.p1 TRINITY_DN19287_c1_g1~~TRINITY_DN19287_c1_g1_i1.p1  ORF type:complete len:1309 (-),score=122.21 TRINITY_DN19287_c1_g1_i1:145-4071(-)